MEAKLAALQAELKTYFDKAAEEKKTFGTLLDTTKTAIDALQKQVDALDLKLQQKAAEVENRSLAQELKENEDVQRLMRDRRGRAYLKFAGGIQELERKAVTSSTVSTNGNDMGTSGVLQIERTPGIVPAARKKLFIRDILTTIPTTLGAIDYVKVENDVSKASPQVEAGAKFANSLTFTTATANVRTIATVLDSSKQILEDFPGLQGFIQQSLSYAVRLEEETQILSGDNTGQNLNGLITQATAFDTTLLTASDGWEYADMIGHAVLQIEEAGEFDPTFIALPPRVWWKIRMQKDANGQYIYGNPAAGDMNFSLFGLTPIRSRNVSNTQFLVGSSVPTNVVIRDRMELIVEISTENEDNFKKNMVTFRAEERLALVVFRPAAFIKGTFSQSPA